MIADWHTNKVYFSELLKERFPVVHGEIEKALAGLGIQPHYLSATKDIWARDYMPVQVSESRFVEYRYDPDYLQGKVKGYRDKKTYPDLVINRNDLAVPYKTDLILDGGNVVKSENTIVLTDKVAVENRLTKTETERLLGELFEVEKVVLIPWYKKEIYGHSDGVLRFNEKGKVLLHEVEKSNEKLLRKLRESRLDYEWLSFNVPKRSKDNWAYINFLQMEDAILVPGLGVEEDEQALKQIRAFFKESYNPNRIVQVNVKDIVKHGGALNCISWTIKE